MKLIKQYKVTVVSKEIMIWVLEVIAFFTMYVAFSLLLKNTYTMPVIKHYGYKIRNLYKNFLNTLWSNNSDLKKKNIYYLYLLNIAIYIYYK